MSLMGQSEKIQSIQSLRGIACLMVVVFHTLNWTRSASHWDVWKAIWRYGDMGVDLFFIVSGFIMFSIRDRYVKNGQPQAAHFIWKRFLRVAPPYWLYTVLVIAIFVTIPSLNNGEFPSIIRSSFLITDSKPLFVMVGWSLSFEIYFYIIFALSLKFCKNSLSQFF